MKQAIGPLAACLAAAMTMAGCSQSSSSADAKSVDDMKQLRVIVPSAAGGGLDQYARLLQPILSDETSTTVVVENIEAGSGIVGMSELTKSGGDCSSIVFTQTPAVNYAALMDEAPFAIDDFVPIAKLVDETGVLRVRKDSPWDSFEEFVDDAKSRPGEISVSVSSINSNNFTAMGDLQEVTGAEFNVVPFDGGGPSREALVAGDVDATNTSLFGSLSIAEDTKVLAVQADENEWADLTDDAPTMTEALGVEVPSTSSTYGFFASAECADEHPELLSSVEGLLVDVGQDPAFAEKLEPLQLDGSISVEGSEDYAVEVAAATETIERNAEK